MTATKIASVEALMAAVRRDYQAWNTKSFPWFRGEPLAIATPLRPALFRGPHDENRLLQQFRQKAPSLGLGVIPPRDHTDQWLFLARHVGPPTRLLDWTEGLLIASLFAVIDGKGEPRAEKDGATSELRRDAEAAERGIPRIAPPPVAQIILERLRRLSAPLGIEIRVEDGVGVLQATSPTKQKRPRRAP